LIRHLVFAAAMAASVPTDAARTPVVGPASDASADSALYRVLLVRAAPGRLLELIEVYKRQIAVHEAESTARPYLFRHSQGDQWDLMLFVPLGESTSYSVAGGVDGLTEAPDGLVAWREELLARGPGSGQVHDALDGAGFLHVEMFVALPGKREALLEQRRMENEFLGAIRRPENLIFTRAGGASWDLFTLGAYDDLQHFAEPTAASPDEQQRAAVAAGFEGADRIGSYLRTLIAYHHDTLAVMVQ
jgi:hypothetical protein